MMLPKNRVTSKSRLQSSLIARIVMLLFAWTGPVPVVHDHAALVVSEVGASHLIEHLQRFHVPHGLGRLTEDCFHVHWTFSCGEDETFRLQPSTQAHRDFVDLNSADTLEFSETLDIGFTPWVERPVCPTVGHSSSRRPTHFLSSNADHRSLPERLSVMIC